MNRWRMGETQRLDKVVADIKESVSFLRSLLDARSRIEFVLEQLNEVSARVHELIDKPDLDPSIRAELSSISEKVRSMILEARSLIEVIEKDYRNQSTRTRVWE